MHKRSMHKHSLILIAGLIVSVAALSAVVYSKYQSNSVGVGSHFANDVPKQWGPFFKEAHFALVVHGKVVSKGSRWEVENSGDKMAVSVLPNQIAMVGKEFSGPDSLNWQPMKVSDISIGDEVYINGFYDTKGKYLNSAIIFVKK